MTTPSQQPPPAAVTATASAASPAAVPVSASGTSATSTVFPTPSEPTLEQLREAETELNELLDRKKLVDRELQSIETRIFNLETTYLEDTSAYGNIIRGYEGYLTQKPMQKKVKAMDTDRLFSLSSTSYQKALEHLHREERMAREVVEMDTDSDAGFSEMQRKKISSQKKKMKQHGFARKKMVLDDDDDE